MRNIVTKVMDSQVGIPLHPKHHTNLGLHPAVFLSKRASRVNNHPLMVKHQSEPVHLSYSKSEYIRKLIKSDVFFNIRSKTTVSTFSFKKITTKKYFKYFILKL